MTSQNNEDGILLYLFSLFGTTNKLAVEIGANCDSSDIGNPECNTANLVLNHGWNSLIIDGSALNTSQLTHFFASALNTKHFHWYGRSSLKEGESYYYVPIVRERIVTAENINNIFSENKIPEEIDLLSIDVDGMDYWLWDSISVTSARIVVIEFDNKISPNVAGVLPYKSNHIVDMDNYLGNSLSAFVKLGKKKGYTLVGVNNCRINAFFVRDDVLSDVIPEYNYKAMYHDQKFHLIEKKDHFTNETNKLQIV